MGAALVRAYASKFDVVGFARSELDLGQLDRLRSVLQARDFDVLINCAAQTNVDRCEKERAEAFALNAEAPGVLAEICAEKSARLIHISTDYVFDGEKREPYVEEDEAKPISVYGESKLEGERRVLAAEGKHVVARVSWVFGPDRPSFIDWVIEQARTKKGVAAVADKFSTPTYTLDLAEMLPPLWDPATTGGIFHLSNRGQCSWREYGQWALDCCERKGIPLRTRTLGGLLLCEMKQFVARRPVYSALATDRYDRLTGRKPRPWQEAVRDYVKHSLG